MGAAIRIVKPFEDPQATYKRTLCRLCGPSSVVQSLSGCAVGSRNSERRPPPTSFWSVKDSVGAGRALPFPVDHSHVQRVVAERLQAGQHAVGPAALESEDLLLDVASVSLRRALLCLPVVNLKGDNNSQDAERGRQDSSCSWNLGVRLCPRKFPGAF